MSRSYKNTNLNSIIEEIIVPEDSENLDGQLINCFPRIKLRRAIEELQLQDRSFEKLQKDSNLYVMKNKEGYFDDLIHTLAYLKQLGLIDNSFKESIILNENSIYQKQMQTLVKRRMYEYPHNEKSLIEAVIIQQHGYEDAAFLSYTEEQYEELLRVCEVNHLGMDKMPSSSFEQYAIIFGPENLTPAMALEGLKRAGIIDEKFKDFILSQEQEIPNEKSIYQKQMQTLVKRRLYEYPHNEKSLIEAVIIQKHGSEERAFLSYTEEQHEELLRVCEVNHLGLDKMPSSRFEQYAIIYGPENLTPAMALEGLKRAGIIDEKFKDFILSQEQEIPQENVEKEVNDEEIARRFDLRYDVLADYALTSNHRFYQPNETATPAKYSDTMIQEEKSLVQKNY